MTLERTLADIDSGSADMMVPLPEGWMQGRTLYGGVAGLFAYRAALRAVPHLPPLRAAQLTFTAPIDGEFQAVARILRQGRNVIQIETTIETARGPAQQGVWLFGAAGTENAINPAPVIDTKTAPEDSAEIDRSGHVPQFLGNYDLRKAVAGEGRIAIRRWARAHDRDLLDRVGELVLLGDALPPGSLKAMQRPGPLSSMNWSFNVLDPAITTRDGWWLVETASLHAAGGYSSERLSLWNADGVLAMTGLQSVAIFG